jgi:quercetin dioxygenase-like cupin family protein
MKNFKKLGEVDVANANWFINSSPDLWKLETFRQDHPLSPHKDTETIYLAWPKNYDAHAALYALDSEYKPCFAFPALKKLLHDTQEVIKKTILRAIIVKLKPGGHISAHIDQGPWAEKTDRYHIILSTNSCATLSVEDEEITGEPGEVWWFNKHASHRALNNGKTDRIHLIVDVLK